MGSSDGLGAWLLLLHIRAELLHNSRHALVEFGRDLECRVRIDIEAAIGFAEVNFVVELASHDLCILVALEPLDALALLPETAFGRRAWHNVGTEAVLLSTAPVTGVGAAI